MKNYLLLLTLVFAPAIFGCNETASSGSATQAGSSPSVVFISVVSDPTKDAQSVDMAMKFAGFALDEGREAVMFFNVKGVTCPKSDLPADLNFGDNDSIKSQLASLIERGADIHVCPICMKAFGIEKSDLVDGAKVTTRPSLFAKLGSGTVTMTY